MTIGENEAAVLSPQDIGAEHQRMMELIRTLCDLIRARGTGEAIRTTAQELLQYTEVHFGHEKLLMERTRYPNRYTHLWEHRELLDKLAMLIHSVEGADAVVTPPVIEFIEKWFNSHLQGSDAALGAFLARREQHPS